MLWTWYDAPVVKIIDENDKTKRFWIDMSDTNFTFEPGQFVTLDLPISDKRTKRWRSYSIANKVSELPLIELCIVNLEGGLGTEYLFNEVKVGDILRFKGPDGAFISPKALDHDIVLIGTGTGVAPFRPMIYDLLVNQKTKHKIHLIFGTQYEKGILYRKEFEQLATDYENFSYAICLSRQEDWDGYKGYVHQVYQQDYPQVRPDIKFFLCGWTAMIDEALANLIVHMKYDKSQIRYELYG